MDSPEKAAKKTKKTQSDDSQDDALDVVSRESKKSRRDDHVEQGTPTSTTGPSNSPKAEKKKRSKAISSDDRLQSPSDRINGDEAEVPVPREEPTDLSQKKQKKSKHSEHISSAVDDANAPVTAQKQFKVKKHKPKDSETTEKSRKGKVPEVPEHTSGATKKNKEKKRKRKRDAESRGEAAAADETATEKPKKKRRKRGKTDIPDPGEDESLSDQARKALQYAFSQFDDPPSWKFNKARQNWLIRNALSALAIPDLHIPLLARYLTGVQGGVREALVKSCQEALTSSNVELNPAAPAYAPASGCSALTTARSADETRRSRATLVLKALTTSDS